MAKIKIYGLNVMVKGDNSITARIIIHQLFGKNIYEKTYKTELPNADFDLVVTEVTDFYIETDEPNFKKALIEQFIGRIATVTIDER